MKTMHRGLGLLAALLTAATLWGATIPNGTRISVRNTTSLNSGTAKVGQSWTGSLNQDLVVNGATVAVLFFPLVLLLVAFAYGVIKIPSLVNSLFTGRSGEYVFPYFGGH